MRYILFTLLFFVLSTACKKKEEEKPYEPVKQKFTDIPGDDAYIANTDTAFVDTGLVITVKGRGFDSKYLKHYTLSHYGQDTYYSYDTVPKYPQVISINESQIVFRYPKNYFELENCNSRHFNFRLVKYSDDPIAELNYMKRFQPASGPKRMLYEYSYEIIKDTVLLEKGMVATNYFIAQYGMYTCAKISLLIGTKEIKDDNINLKRCYNIPSVCYMGIPWDEVYNFPDGNYEVKVLRDGKGLYRSGVKRGIYVRNVR